VEPDGPIGRGVLGPELAHGQSCGRARTQFRDSAVNGMAFRGRDQGRALRRSADYLQSLRVRA
jgi:hypothetical protein